MFAVAAMFALTSGSTIIFMFADDGDPVWPLASDIDVVYVTVVPAFCCDVLKLNTLEIVLPVSPATPDPTETF